MTEERKPKSQAFRRTHKVITEAFISLVERMPFEKITIQDILTEAMISRYTFYHHFKDKYDIAEQLQDYLYEDFVSVYDTLFYKNDHTLIGSTDETPEIHAQKRNHLQTLLQKNLRYTKAITKIHTDRVDLNQKFIQYFAQKYAASQTDDKDPLQVQFEAHLYAAQINAIISYNTLHDGDSIDLSIYDNMFDVYSNVFLYTTGMSDQQKIKNCKETLLQMY